MKQYTAFLITLITLVSCQEKKEQLETINGTWQSIGSGWFLSITDSTEYAFYDITAISCLPNRNGKLTELVNDLQLQNDTLSLKKGVITYRFTRSQNLPEKCTVDLTKTEKNDVLYNFEVFTETIKEHYAFMEFNNINWDSLYVAQKAKLKANLTDINLYHVLDETLETLNDNHGYLEASDELYETLEQLETEEENEVAEANVESLPEYGDLQIALMVKDHHLKEELTKDSKLIKWGKLTDSIGYIQIMAMWLHADLNIPQEMIDEKGYLDAYVDTFHQMYEGDYIKKEVEAVRVIMNHIMKDLSGMEAIVMDVRFNGGGQDAVSFEILNRFTKSSMHIVNQKLHYGKNFSPVLPLYLEGSQNAFIKPVYVLTSPQTGSAAEAFSIATMAMPHVKRIGSATSGAMSTALEKTLPNGWALSISNEIYMDTQNNFYENKGVPVDYELGYSRERQSFFRAIADDLKKDRQDILKAIDTLSTK